MKNNFSAKKNTKIGVLIQFKNKKKIIYLSNSIVLFKDSLLNVSVVKT
jgi:hypothetical protein